MTPRPWWHWVLIGLAVLLTGGFAWRFFRRPGKHELDAAKAQGQREAFEVQAGAAREAGDALAVDAAASREVAVTLSAQAQEAAQAVERATVVLDERARKVDAASDLDSAVDEFNGRAP
jgi:hypothetical protein